MWNWLARRVRVQHVPWGDRPSPLDPDHRHDDCPLCHPPAGPEPGGRPGWIGSVTEQAQPPWRKPDDLY
jgi:hypothetical protein